MGAMSASASARAPARATHRGRARQRVSAIAARRDKARARKIPARLVTRIIRKSGTTSRAMPNGPGMRVRPMSLTSGPRAITIAATPRMARATASRPGLSLRRQSQKAPAMTMTGSTSPGNRLLGPRSRKGAVSSP